jgi:hypothetical protein
MGTNFHTALTGASTWTTAGVNPVFASLDRGITYLKNVQITCDGVISYNSGTRVLSWAGILRIHFNTAAGLCVYNTIAIGSITITSGYFVYVDLNETNGTALTMQQAALSAGGASNFITYNRLVLAVMNASSSELYPVNMVVGFGVSGYSGMSGYSGTTGSSGYSGMVGTSGYSGFSSYSGYSGLSSYSGYSGYSGISGDNPGSSGYSGYSGISGDNPGSSGYSGYSGYSGIVGTSGYSGYQPGALDGTDYSASYVNPKTIDWNNGATQYITLTGACAITLSNGATGKVYRLFILNDGTGGYAVTWSTTINWRDSTTPTQTQTASKGDWYTFVYSNSKWFGDQATNFGNS